MHATIPKGYMGYDQYTVAVEPTFAAFFWHQQPYVHGLWCHSFKFPWRTWVNAKPPTIPFGVVTCTFFDNLSWNSCMFWASILLPYQSLDSRPSHSPAPSWKRGPRRNCEAFHLHNWCTAVQNWKRKYALGWISTLLRFYVYGRHSIDGPIFYLRAYSGKN